MTACVVDASVAAKWYLPPRAEPLAAEAAGLLKSYAAGRVRLLVPDLFWPETGNVLWKAVRGGRISRSTAESAIGDLQALRISTAPTAPLLADAFAIADAQGRSVYDSVYIALAVLSDMPLVTADERLANALAARFPIWWLGAI